MNDRMRPLLGVVICGLAFLAIGRTPVLAQEEGRLDMREVVKEISAELEKIQKNMFSLTGSGDQTAGHRVVENVDKLLDELKASQGKVVSNIDELLKRIAERPTSGGGGQCRKPGDNNPTAKRNSNSKADHNAKEGEDRRDPKRRKVEDKSKDTPETSRHPNDDKDNSGKNPKDPKQSRSGEKPREKDRETSAHDAIRDAWGFLPNEARQKLVDGNIKEFFPNYDMAIKEYLKSLNKK